MCVRETMYRLYMVREKYWLYSYNRSLFDQHINHLNHSEISSWERCYFNTYTNTQTRREWQTWRPKESCKFHPFQRLERSIKWYSFDNLCFEIHVNNKSWHFPSLLHFFSINPSLASVAVIPFLFNVKKSFLPFHLCPGSPWIYACQIIISSNQWWWIHLTY